MTQEQLAMMLGVSRQSVTKWESERSYPEMDKLLKLCQVFDCTLDDLVQGDLTDRQPDPAAAAPKAPPADVFGYDEHARRLANRVSSGVFLVIFGVAVSLLFFAAADPAEAILFQLPENVAAAIGTLCIFAAIAGALALTIPAGMEHSHFMRLHPYIEDFYTEEQKAQARSSFTAQLIGGIATIFFGICLLLLLGGSSGMEPLRPRDLLVLSVNGEMLGTVAMLVCIAVGAFFIVHGGMMLARTNLANYNMAAAEVLESHEIAQASLPPEKKEEMLKTKSIDRKIGALCGAIMMIATIVALVMLFVPGYQEPLFWMAWPIGGILCGIVSVLMKGFSTSE